MPYRTRFPDITAQDLEITPIERSETIPSRWYTNPHMLDADNDIIFSKTWQYVGNSASVAQAGNYITATVAGNPVIVVRGKDNILRAFYNVCRHRGGPLALDEQGSCNVLQCKYHGWTYLLDGSLRGVPKFDRAELFDKKDFGLVPVDIDEWEGLLFVNLSGGKENKLQSVLHGIRERITPITIHSKKFARRIVYNVNCNWKVYVDNFLEGYHLPLVHPELCNLLDYQQYVTETFEHYSLQFSPFTGKDNVYGNANGKAFYYFVFPNFMLNILPGRLQTNLVVPIAHNTTSVIFDYYYDDITSPSTMKLIEDDFAYSDKVQQEDIEICERVQKGLESRAYDKGRFSVEMEQGVYHFQCLLKKEYSKIKTR